jgi:phosphatidylserine/phosphatidylglycerophosphate/cardiolipin synthase-like enzyme
VVHEVGAVFTTDWYSETDELLATSQELSTPVQRQGGLLTQVAPSGPAFPTENNLALFNTLIYYAQRRISMTSPYFVPDESLLAALTTAARRGVAVELVVGERGDQFFAFPAQHSSYEVATRRRGADLPLSSAGDPAFEASLRRRTGRGHRLLEHGDPVVPTRPGSDADDLWPRLGR